jgi:hypothetical protein
MLCIATKPIYEAKVINDPIGLVITRNERALSNQEVIICHCGLATTRQKELEPLKASLKDSRYAKQ